MKNVKTIIKPIQIHHAEYYLSKRLEHHHPTIKIRSTFSEACLLKYFPKYYKNLETNLSSKTSWALISRLRLTKTIDSFLSVHKDNIDKAK